MASNKKDICPVCKTHEKGVDSKMCRKCSVQKMMSGRDKKNKPTEIKVGDVTEDNKYYL